MNNDDYMELMNKREELHPELALYLENTGFGQCLKHPLVFNVFHVPQMNAFVNAQYKNKTEYVEKALASKNYNEYIWMHERPYRLQKFLKIMADLSDEEYWHLLAGIWIDSENLWEYKSFLRLILNAKRDKHEKMMTASEHKFFKKLPEEIKIYRGHQIRNKHGFSWTLCENSAKWFSKRHLLPGTKSRVAVATVNKKDVVAVLLGRGEFEVIVDPKNITYQKEKPIQRLPWIENVFNKAKSAFNLNSSVHGPEHWIKVENNVLKLAENLPETDPVVAQLFAILHDCKRETDDDDPQHGTRAAKFAEKLFFDNELQITQDQLKILKQACQFHNDGGRSKNPTIGICWDADRMDLPRIGIIPDLKLFSTQTGKDLLWKI